MAEQMVYIKAEQCSVVTNKKVFLEDVITIYSSDKKLAKELSGQVLMVVPEEKRKKYIFSILKIVDLLQKQHPNLTINNLGETDFIVEYIPPGKKKIAWEWGKTIFVCLAVFFGGAFTIMTFNEDVSTTKVFDLVYELVMGTPASGGSILEIAYSIGIPLGIIVFFNHFSKAKINSDPTPLQVQLRLYEQDENTAIIENASREGKTIDVE